MKHRLWAFVWIAVFLCLAATGFAQERLNLSPLADLNPGVGKVFSLAFTNDGRYLAVGGESGSIYVHDLKQMKKFRQIDGDSGAVSALAFDPDSEFLAGGTDEGLVKLWWLQNGVQWGSHKEHKKSVKTIAVSNNGRLIASGGKDEKIVLWDSGTRMPYGVLEGHKDTIHSVGFLPDGRRLQSSSFDKTTITWDIPGRNELRRLVEPAARYGKLIRTVFGPDGVLFASSIKEVRPAIEGKRQSRGGIKEIDHIQVRNSLSGESVARFDGHLETINDVAFSPDGRFIVSVSDDRSIRAWDIEAGAKSTEMELPDKVQSVAFSPNGRSLAAGLSNGSVKVWTCTGVGNSPVYYAKNIRYRPTIEYLPPFEGRPVRVALVGMKASGGIQQQTVDLLADILQNALSRTGRFELLERRSMPKLMEEQKLHLSDLLDESTAVQIGNIQGAQELVAGTVGKIGNQFAIEVRFIDVGSTKVVRTVQERCDCSEDELFLALEAVANHAAKQAK